MEAWNQNLAAAAAAHGVEFLDFSGTPEITASWYGTADHIAPTHDKAWTELVATSAGARCGDLAPFANRTQQSECGNQQPDGRGNRRCDATADKYFDNGCMRRAAEKQG